ncbi:MAG: SdrD B-like domain-containing protein, partial [Chloroflexota bacterium]
ADIDNDGTQDPAEDGIANATVELLVDSGGGVFVPATDLDGTAVISQTTGADGLYFFDNLPPGDYRVRVTPPSGFAPSATQTTADDDDTENDSNIASEPSTGTFESGTFTLVTDGEPDETETFDGDGQDDANENDGNMTVDFGFVPVQSIGSVIWEDNNSNSLQDVGEPGVTGAVVELLVDSGGGVFVPATTITGTAVLSQTTAADGLYFFDNLPPGDYQVQVTPPAGYEPSPIQTAADNDDTENDSNVASEPISGTFRSGTFTLSLNGEPSETGTYLGDDQDDATDDNNGNMTVDFGFISSVSVGSLIWFDQDGDGLQGGAESAIPGAIVELLVDSGGGVFVPATTITGTAVLSQTTLADGLYHFENLPPGDYRVRVTPPAGYLPSNVQNGNDNDNAENDSNIASEPVAGTYESGTFTLTTNGGPTETGVYDGDDQDNGSETDGNMTIDFGFIQPVSIGSLVWHDVDGDGQQDSLEPGIDGAVVELLVDNGSGTFIPATSITGTAVLSQTTLADGLYFFDNLPPGDYRVQVTPPASYAASPVQMTADDDDTEDDSNIASEPSSGTYQSGTFTLVAENEPSEVGTFDGDGQDNGSETSGNMTVDFGFVEPMSIGSYVWADNNDDGLQDATENGLAGATVTLLVDDGTGAFVPAVDVDGTAVLTQTTGTDGQYNFDNLPPGDYRVRVTPPTGVVPSSTQNAADDDDTENDTNIASEPVAGTFESGTFTLVNDLEPTETGTFDGDDQDNIDDANGNMTIDFGFLPVQSIGSFVWEDLDGSGTQDVGEPGITGATVELLVDSGGGVFVPATTITGTAVLSQVTGADGLYHFDNLPPGDYRVRVTPPAGVVPTYNQNGADNDDADNDSNIASEPITNTFESGTFTLDFNTEPVESGTFDGDAQDDATADGNGNMTIDFGFFQPVAVGNYVWIDDGIGGGTPLNGIVDGTEVGVPDVIVELYHDGDTPGVDAPFITTTTNVSGTYLFDMIPQGDYIIHIPASEFQYGEPLSSFMSSTGHGGDDGSDDDANENGIDNDAPYDNGISSETISLTVGGEPPAETGQGNYTGTLPDTDVNLTIDFGFFELLTLGNVIWFDDDRDGEIDGGESGVPAGVIVNLLDENNDPILHPISGLPITTTTDVDGNYEFTHLFPGEYVVQIDPINFQSGGALEGYISSDGSSDPDDVTSDIDDNGIDGTDPAIDGILTPPVTLDYDAEPDNFDDSDDNDNTNLTIDLGLVLDPTAVSLTSFTAIHLGNGTVSVQWATAAEVDNFGFRIFRSTVNDFATATEIHFEPTAVVGGTGPGSNYSYTDSGVANGTVYYWLVDVETDGDTETHGPVSVQVQPGVRIYLPIIVGGE